MNHRGAAHRSVLWCGDDRHRGRADRAPDPGRWRPIVRVRELAAGRRRAARQAPRSGRGRRAAAAEEADGRQPTSSASMIDIARGERRARRASPETSGSTVGDARKPLAAAGAAVVDNPPYGERLTRRQADARCTRRSARADRLAVIAPRIEPAVVQARVRRHAGHQQRWAVGALRTGSVFTVIPSCPVLALRHTAARPIGARSAPGLAAGRAGADGRRHQRAVPHDVPPRSRPDLVYVNEMVMATALVHGNAKTERMATFGADETPRSLQIYGSDPAMIGEAVRRLVGEDRVDHIDLNFGCPAVEGHPQGRRRGGAGEAEPAARHPPRRGRRGRRRTACPVTAKFRMGIDDDLLTFVRTGRIAEEEGVAAIALHARTAEQHYAGDGRLGRDRRAEGGGRRRSPCSATATSGRPPTRCAMMRAHRLRRRRRSGAAASAGRGCSADLVAAFNGEPVPDVAAARRFVAEQMADHCRLLADLLGEDNAVRDFRKHTSWYLTGYPGRRRGARAVQPDRLAGRARRPARRARPRR